MKVESILDTARNNFGGAENTPDFDDVDLITFANEYQREHLAKVIKLGLITPSKAFTTPANPPIDTDYSYAFTSQPNKIIAATWTPSGGTAAPLAQATERSIRRRLGGNPTLDTGVPSYFWLDWGVLTGATTPSQIICLYKIPSAAGTLKVRAEGAPTLMTPNNDITIPEEFADACAWYVTYRMRCNREDNTDADRGSALSMCKSRELEALRLYNYLVHDKSIRTRLAPARG